MRKLAIVALCAVAAGCGKGPPPPPNEADAAFEKKLQEQFLDAKPGTVIEIPPGKHQLQRVLTLRANGVTEIGRASCRERV